jgi:hypothetical protein
MTTTPEVLVENDQKNEMMNRNPRSVRPVLSASPRFGAHRGGSMPVSTPPPNGILTSTVFDALSLLAYDAASRTFKDGTTSIYMFIERDSSGTLLQWAYGPATAGATYNNPRCEVVSLVGNAIVSGTFNANTGVVSYNGHTYKFRPERDGNGILVVAAVQIT